MAKPVVAESRVAMVADDPEVAVVRLLKGKRRRIGGGHEGESGGEGKEGVEVEVMVAMSIPRGLKGSVAVITLAGISYLIFKSKVYSFIG